jgi:uncharacterized protein YjbI with pentapeptide repeats
MALFRNLEAPGAWLVGEILFHSYFSNANLAEAWCYKTIFMFANLREANMRTANLEGVNLRETIHEKKDFAGRKARRSKGATRKPNR